MTQTYWKLVPVEPTDAMLDAAFDTEKISTQWGVDPFLENTSDVYKAMLAAAPKPPAPQEPVTHLPCCGYADTSALKWNPYNSVAQCHNCGQVYTAAPQPAHQPLTDEQILSIVMVAPALDTAEAEWLHVARAVEAAHGITA